SFLVFVRLRSPQHLILFMLAAAWICAGVDLYFLNGYAAGRLSHWVIMIGTGGAVAVAARRGFLSQGLLPWAATGALAVISMGMAMQDFYPGIATLRSKVSPVMGLCHADVDHKTPVVCFSLAHEADSLVFHLGTHRVRSYDSDEVALAVAALDQGSEIIVVAN